MKRIFFLSFLLLQVTVNAQMISTVAGDGILGHIGDGSPAISAMLDYPMAVKFDMAGNYFISELEGCRIRKIDVFGVITTVAGTGSCGYNGDHIMATSSQLNNPTGIAIDSIGNLYIADDYNNRVRKIDVTTGIITTIAGNGTAGFGGDNGPSTSGIINNPYDVCFDAHGNLYIADAVNYLIRKINTEGIITTFAGNGSSLFSGEGGPATVAGISEVYGLCTDAIGNIFLAARFAGRVLKIDTDGILTTICGNGLGYNTGDGGPATAAQLNPEKLAFDKTGNLYISCIYKNCVRKIDTFGIINHMVGLDSIGGYNGDGGLADTSELNEPEGMDFDPCGNLYIADDVNNRIRKVTFNPSCSLDSLDSVATLAVNNINVNAVITVYPNPATDEITISASNIISQITIINMVGQVVYEKEYYGLKAEVNISDLSPGMYMVAVTDEKGNKTVKKIVKE